MTVKTTLSFTDRHAGWIARKVEEGVFATQSAAVAAAVERMMEDDAEREAAMNAMINGMAEEIRRRAETPREEFLDFDGVFESLRAKIEKMSEG